MSKAEERALERFPVHEGASKEWTEMHLKSICTEYIEGYHQAEKDLELTWEDVRDIIETYHKFTQKNLWAQYKTLADGYQEILKRFKAQKGG